MNKCIALLSLSLLPFTAAAEHSDIWLTVNNNQVVISPVDLETNLDVPIDIATNRLLFTGDFSDVAGGDEGTSNPGFQAAVGTFSSNATILYYRAVGELYSWNGSAWVNSVSDQEKISIFDALSTETIWRTSGVTNAEGPIEQIASDGSFHHHRLYAISNSSTPTAGAYLVDMEVYTTAGLNGTVVDAASEPFRIAFNYQLDDAEFDTAIAALTTTVTATDVQVPMPLWALCVLGFGLFVTGIRVKRHF